MGRFLVLWLAVQVLAGCVPRPRIPIEVRDTDEAFEQIVACPTCGEAYVRVLEQEAGITGRKLPRWEDYDIQRSGKKP